MKTLSKWVHLTPMQSLWDGLVDIIDSVGWEGGTVCGGLGSLSRVTLTRICQTTSGVLQFAPEMSYEGALEIVSLAGTFGHDTSGKDWDLHLHGVMVDCEGRLLAGHLLPTDCTVLITFEAILLHPTHLQLTRKSMPTGLAFVENDGDPGRDIRGGA